MMPATRQRIAMSMYAMVDCMALRPTPEVSMELNKHLGIMAGALDYLQPVPIAKRTDPVSSALVMALGVMIAVEKRHDEGQGLALTEDEAAILRRSSGKFDDALRMIPYNVYEASRIFVEGAMKNLVTEQAGSL